MLDTTRPTMRDITDIALAVSGQGMHMVGKTSKLTDRASMRINLHATGGMAAGDDPHAWWSARSGFSMDEEECADAGTCCIVRRGGDPSG